MSDNTYDLVPYQSSAFPQSQPEQIASVARLFGLEPAAPSRARVLELGCSAGGNIIPLAARYPNARFVGIDYSQVQVDAANKTIREIGLKNIEVLRDDIGAFKAREPRFDYIICHGVFSWVPVGTQESIFKLIRANLAERGVAYVSYNVYPGWKMREVVRDAMMYHTRSLTDPAQRLQQARAITDYIKRISDERSAFGKMLAEEAAIIGRAQDFYLYHEHLETNNWPVYFREFIERAGVHELGYLGEAQLSDMAPQRLGKEVFDTLQKLSGGNILATEQYMDFFRNRSFRQTLLVPSAQLAHVKRAIGTESLKNFLMSLPMFPQRAGRVDSGEEIEFKSPQGRSIKTALPLMKAMLLEFAERHPEPVDFDALMAGVRRRLDGKIVVSDQDLAGLGDTLLRFLLDGVLKLHVEPARFGAANAAKPMAFAAARIIALRGPAMKTVQAAQPAAVAKAPPAEAPVTVPTLKHDSVSLAPIEARMLALFDGQKTTAQVIDLLTEQTAAKKLTLMKDNIQLTEPDAIRPILTQLLAESLQRFQKLGLLAAN